MRKYTFFNKINWFAINLSVIILALIFNAPISSDAANPGDGFYNATANLINAENNYWGSASGPYHPTLNPSGAGNAVSDNVDFTPWLTSWP